ncbi:MAG: TrkH family potassium uptake protein [Elusimicrobiota bacterium]|nr:TrkH family potassium uptake protein [Elusimicrobiota bacterium]
MKSQIYKLILGFFIILIFCGTIFLSLPWVANRQVPLIDRIFTVTSAVCVTGLTVLDISSTFNFAGQLIILLLIQVGGLGYMILGTLIIVLFGKLSLVQKSAVGESLNVVEFNTISQIIPLMKKVLILTFIFEFIGALLLFLKFFIAEQLSVSTSIWYAVFHSVSAFCNAGFSLFPDSFVRYRGDLAINIIIPLLIISGGLGFFVWLEILQVLRKRKENFSLHTKIVVLMTLVLVLIGMLVIFIFNNYNFSLQKIPFKTRVLISWFQAVTPRTAGFNTFPIQELSPVSIMIIILLMFIGSSPGGTGGGIKTTTFFVLMSSVYNYIAGERYVTVFKRRIDTNVILKSFTIFFISLCWVFLVSMLFSWFNYTYDVVKFSFKEIFFETVSAFGTVGLSLGITPYIDNFAKILLILTMLFGRVGGLAILSLLLTKEQKEIKYLEEPISVG